VKAEEIRELYPLYIGGELSEDENSAVEAYLRDHPQEKVEVDKYRRSVELMREGGKEIVEVSTQQWQQLSDGVKSRLDTSTLLDEVEIAIEQAKPSRLLPIMRWAAAAMLLFSVGLAAYAVKQWLKPDPVPINLTEELRKVRELRAQKNIQTLSENPEHRKPIRDVMKLEFLAELDIEKYTKTVKGIVKKQVVLPTAFPNGTVMHFEVGKDKIQFVWIVDDVLQLVPEQKGK